MNLWHRLTLKFPGIQRKSVGAELELTTAYREVFAGRPTQQHQQMVLADLMARSGYNMVMPATVSDAHLRQNEGKRELFGHIYSHLALADSDVRALEVAARNEAATMQQFE